MEDIKHLLGKKIKELRKVQGLSQQQLAELANIDQRSLSHIECGNTFPSKALLDLSKALNISLPELFDFDYLGIKEEDKIKYIKDNIEILEPKDIDILYRLIKLMR